MTDTPSTPSRWAIFGKPNRLARRLGAGAGVDRNPFIDVSDSGSNDLLLLPLVQGVELAVGTQDEDAVDPPADKVVDE